MPRGGLDGGVNRDMQLEARQEDITVRAQQSLHTSHQHVWYKEEMIGNGIP